MRAVAISLLTLLLTACGGGGGGGAPVDPSPSPTPTPTPTPTAPIPLPANNDLTLWGRTGLTACTILAPASGTVIDTGTRAFSYFVPTAPLFATYTLIDQLDLVAGADRTVFTDLWNPSPGSWYVVSEGSLAATITWEFAIPYWNGSYSVGTHFGTLQNGSPVWVRALDTQGTHTHSVYLDATIDSAPAISLSGGQLVTCYLINWDRSVFRVSDGFTERDVGIVYFRPDVGIVSYALQHHVNGVWVHSRTGKLTDI